MAEQVREGNYGRFGASSLADGICFTFEGEKDSDCAIRLYEKQKRVDQPCAYRDIPVPKEFCIGAVRSVCIDGLDAEQYDYNYVIDGNVVVDPYARRVVGREKWGDYRRRDVHYEVHSGFDFSEFDWKNDHCPEIAGTDMVLYKLHVRGFTKDGGVSGRTKGTYAAIVEKIPYLKELGITTVELMPAYEFEELVPPKHEEHPMDFEGWAPQAVAGYQLMQQREYEEKEKELPGINYWGYGSGNYFAPKASYASGNIPSVEMKEMIRSLHEAGLECVMEMSFDAQVNPNYIVEVLRYWVLEYHVDGFHLLCSDTAVASVVCDVLLRRTKIFALHFPDEAWNQQSAYPHLYVYNDDFLYAARKLINHQDGNMVEYLNQQKKQHPNIGFVNYFANNNGFTLADTFSYVTKHNEENGEEGADGNDWNYSVNCGVEGVTRKKKILQQRGQLMRQAIAAVVLAQGVPLIFAGDEFGNSQNGNNNAYCQDNQVGWVNWKQLEKHGDYFSYVRSLLALRKMHPCMHNRVPMQMTDYQSKGTPDLSYHSAQAWNSEIYPSMQAIGEAYCGAYADEAEDFYIGWNFSQSGMSLGLPKAPHAKEWRVVLGDGVVSGDGDRLQIAGCSTVVLVTAPAGLGSEKHAGIDAEPIENGEMPGVEAELIENEEKPDEGETLTENVKLPDAEEKLANGAELPGAEVKSVRSGKLTDFQVNLSESLGMPDAERQPSGNREMPDAEENRSGDREVPDTEENHAVNREIPGLEENHTGNGEMPAIAGNGARDKEILETEQACIEKNALDGAKPAGEEEKKTAVDKKPSRKKPGKRQRRSRG